jgi:hypothetical protein
LIGAHANGEYGDPVGERTVEVVAPGVGLPPAADADRVRLGSATVASGNRVDELSDPGVVGADLQNHGLADRRVTVHAGAGSCRRSRLGVLTFATRPDGVTEVRTLPRPWRAVAVGSVERVDNRRREHLSGCLGGGRGRWVDRAIGTASGRCRCWPAATDDRGVVDAGRAAQDQRLRRGLNDAASCLTALGPADNAHGPD